MESIKKLYKNILGLFKNAIKRNWVTLSHTPQIHYKGTWEYYIDTKED